MCLYSISQHNVFLDSFVLLVVSVILLLLSNISLYENNLFICTPVDGHLDCFQLLAIMNKSTVNKWQPTPVFLPGKSHGQRSLVGYSPWGHKESDVTKVIWYSISQYGHTINDFKHTLIWGCLFQISFFHRNTFPQFLLHNFVCIC